MLRKVLLERDGGGLQILKIDFFGRPAWQLAEFHLSIVDVGIENIWGLGGY